MTKQIRYLELRQRKILRKPILSNKDEKQFQKLAKRIDFLKYGKTLSLQEHILHAAKDISCPSTDAEKLILDAAEFIKKGLI